MHMSFSVGTGRVTDIRHVARLARTADECGYSRISFPDTPAVNRDVHVMMTVTALNTRRIHIGHGVTDPLNFHPCVIANATATIDELSGGRAYVGLGAGGPVALDGRCGDVVEAPGAELGHVQVVVGVQVVHLHEAHVLHRGDFGPGALERRFVELHVTGQGDFPGTCDRLVYGRHLGRREADRFLDQDVLAGLKAIDHGRGLGVRMAKQDRVDVGCEHLPVIGEL